MKWVVRKYTATKQKLSRPFWFSISTSTHPRTYILLISFILHIGGGMEVHRRRSRLEMMPRWWRVVMCVSVVAAVVVLLSRAVASSGHSDRVGGVMAELRTSDDGPDQQAVTEVRDWTLVVYVYWERDETYAENLRYFLRVGTGTAEESKRDRVEYLIIVQGESLSVTVPPHVKVWRRPNTCYDFGAVGEALRNLPLPSFRFYVILYRFVPSSPPLLPNALIRIPLALSPPFRAGIRVPRVRTFLRIGHRRCTGPPSLPAASTIT